jgi:tetratricopeptide (TPR) repeat protein
MPSRTFALGLMLSFGVAAGASAALADDLREVTRLHHAGQATAALERADRYLAANPKDAQMRFLKSVVLADAGQRAEAIALLQALVQDYPELAEPHNNLAALHAAAGDYGKAREELEETLRLNPSFAPAHENLGDVYVRLAGESYARALLAEPASASLPRKLALVRQLNLPTLAATR